MSSLSTSGPDTASREPAGTHYVPSATATGGHRALIVWLGICCAMVAAMVVIGGITRLTESGLSITDWQPVSGIVPPFSDAAWQEAFADYRTTTEYQQLNQGMTLDEFKSIYWWEFVHRLWGRTIGLVFLVPFVWFLWRRRVPGWAKPHLWAVFGLGAVQGVIGWWMVQSGLTGRTDVSQYRLTVHLMMALAIFAYMLGIAWRMRAPPAAPVAATFVGPGHRLLLTVLALVTLVWGGLTAGANAGMVYPEFPTMGGRLVPLDLIAIEPGWLNFFENMVAIQWAHRLIATLTLLAVLAYWLRAAISAARCPGAVHGLAVVVLAQYALGATTVLTGVSFHAAIGHQAGAVAVTAMLTLLWAGRARAGS